MNLTYSLPASRVRVTSSVTSAVDSVLGTDIKTPQTAVALEIGADEKRWTLGIHSGWIFNTAASLELTDEGLLKSGNIESTGELGKIIVGVVGAAATVAGAIVSPGGFVGAITSNLHMAFMAETHEAPRREKRKPEELEADAFAEANPEAAHLRDRVKASITKLRSDAVELAERLADLPPEEDATPMRARLWSLRVFEQSLQIQLDALNELFKAWRATTIETTITQYERLLSIDAVRAADPHVLGTGQLYFKGAASKEVDFAWNELGVALAVDQKGDAGTADTKAPGKDEIVVRVPRMAVLNLYERRPDGTARLKESKPHLIMDSACATETVKLHKSAWAKRGVSLGFSELGALKSYSYSADSAAAAVAGTAGSLPATVSDSLEKAAKIRESVGTLQDSGLQQELAKAKLEAELKQQELTRAGLAATATDYATLERLKQRAAMLEQRKTIREARPIESLPDPVAVEIAELKRNVELLTLRAKLGQLDPSA